MLSMEGRDDGIERARPDRESESIFILFTNGYRESMKRAKAGNASTDSFVSVDLREIGAFSICIVSRKDKHLSKLERPSSRRRWLS